MTDRDERAQVSIASDGADGMIVTVRLEDGRSATRRLRVPEQLESVIEALVELPPAGRADEAPVAPTPAPTASLMFPDPQPPTRREASELSGDVALLGTTRVLGAPAVLGFGLLLSGDLNIARGWIVGLRARADVVHLNLEDAEPTGGTFGGGLELARRWPVTSQVDLDFGIGVDGLADVPYESGGRGRGGSDLEGDVRPRAFGKIWVPRGKLAFTGIVGFELSPLRLGDGEGGRNRSHPAFGAELGVGIGWGDLQ